MTFSVYTSLFNYSQDKFDLIDTFENWLQYSNEIVIGTFKDQKPIIEKSILDDFGKDSRIKVVAEKDTSLSDPFFDGKLKNVALQNCENELVIQQDMDERIGGDKQKWIDFANKLIEFGFPIACFIPVIDLYKDLNHYKSIGAKWYLHSKKGTYRGPVNFAKRSDGTIDTDKSDSCELINKDGDLITTVAGLKFKETMDISYPHVIHLGYLDLNKRIENNKFWQPVWSARNGSNVEVALSENKIEEENEYKPHNLGNRWW